MEAGGGGLSILYHEGAPLTLTASTFSGNSTDGHAGAIFIGSDFPVSIENCTFASNTTAGNGAALFVGTAHVDVTSSTFAHHTADYGPAIFCGEACSMTIRNSVFAWNAADHPYDAMACSKTVDGDHNVQWPATRLGGGEDNPCVEGIAFADPLLGDLADNGGPTRTMLPQAGSPALGAGEDCPALDQRGVPRSEPCDAGAVELPH